MLVLQVLESLQAASAAQPWPFADGGKTQVELPDQMPEKCNFYGLLKSALTPEAVAQRFAAAGWSVAETGGEHNLEVGWGRLTLAGGDPMVLQGRLDRPDDRVGELLGLLAGPELNGVYQWINSEGRLWRELPFDESMLNPDDPRLPADIKESIRATRASSASSPQSRKPWWRFW
jgi:hypothetical protein